MSHHPIDTGDTEEIEPSGEPLGKYNIERKIGIGGMAEIYLASLKTDANSFFAIKKILPQFTSDEQLIAMLVNEAKVMLSLRHPNIVPLYDFGRDGQSYYLAMEFVRGADLKNIINSCRKKGVWIPIKIALYIMMEVLEGLAYAHKRRDNFNRSLDIIHRDISPQNLMISNQGEIKILDFGIAKIRGGISRTQTGMLKGKFSYMSPEQAVGAKLDRRTDLFSAAIVFYELLTLENPFMAENEIKILENIRSVHYPSPRHFNQNISKSIEKMLQKAMRRRLSRRYAWAELWQKDIYTLQKKEFGFATAADLKAFLDQLLHGKNTVAAATELATELPAKQYQFARRDRTTDVQFVHAQRQKWLRRTVVTLLLIVGLFTLSRLAIKWQQQLRYYAYTALHKVDPRWFKKTALQAWQYGQELWSMNFKKPIDMPSVEPKVESVKPQLKIELDANTPIVFVEAAWQQLSKLNFAAFEKQRDQLLDLMHANFMEHRDEAMEPQQIYTRNLGKYRISYRMAADGYGVEVVKVVSR